LHGTRFLQQIQGGQQIEFIENEIEPGNRASQPRVRPSKSSSIQNPNLLASLNLLEIFNLKFPPSLWWWALCIRPNFRGFLTRRADFAVIFVGM
jgi:hypothetical protein